MQIFLVTTYSIVSLLIFTANISAILVIWTNRILQSNTYIFITSLSVAYFIRGFLMLPLFVVAAFYQERFTLNVRCNLYIIITMINSITGICCAYTNLGISLDRFRSIVQSGQRKKFTKRTCLNIILSIWLLAIAYSLPEIYILVAKKHKSSYQHKIGIPGEGQPLFRGNNQEFSSSLPLDETLLDENASEFLVDLNNKEGIKYVEEIKAITIITEPNKFSSRAHGFNKFANTTTKSSKLLNKKSLILSSNTCLDRSNSQSNTKKLSSNMSPEKYVIELSRIKDRTIINSTTNVVGGFKVRLYKYSKTFYSSCDTANLPENSTKTLKKLPLKSIHWLYNLATETEVRDEPEPNFTNNINNNFPVNLNTLTNVVLNEQLQNSKSAAAKIKITKELLSKGAHFKGSTITISQICKKSKIFSGEKSGRVPGTETLSLPSYYDCCSVQAVAGGSPDNFKLLRPPSDKIYDMLILGFPLLVNNVTRSTNLGSINNARAVNGNSTTLYAQDTSFILHFNDNNSIMYIKKSRMAHRKIPVFGQSATISISQNFSTGGILRNFSNTTNKHRNKNICAGFTIGYATAHQPMDLVSNTGGGKRNYEIGTYECVLNKRESMLSVALQLVIGVSLPLTIASVLYILIVRFLWENNVKLRTLNDRSIRNLQAIAIKRSLRAIKMMIALLLLYAVCTIPFYVLAILEMLDHINFSYNFFHLHNILIVTDHWLHVGLYLYFNNTFKRAFAQTFQRLLSNSGNWFLDIFMSICCSWAWCCRCCQFDDPEDHYLEEKECHKGDDVEQQQLQKKFVDDRSTRFELSMWWKMKRLEISRQRRSRIRKRKLKKTGNQQNHHKHHINKNEPRKSWRSNYYHSSYKYNNLPEFFKRFSTTTTTTGGRLGGGRGRSSARYSKISDLLNMHPTVILDHNKNMANIDNNCMTIPNNYTSAANFVVEFNPRPSTSQHTTTTSLFTQPKQQQQKQPDITELSQLSNQLDDKISTTTRERDPHQLLLLKKESQENGKIHRNNVNGGVEDSKFKKRYSSIFQRLFSKPIITLFHPFHRDPSGKRKKSRRSTGYSGSDSKPIPKIVITNAEVNQVEIDDKEIHHHRNRSTKTIQVEQHHL